MPYQKKDGTYIIRKDAQLHKQRIEIGDFGAFYNPVTNILSIRFKDTDPHTTYKSFPVEKGDTFQHEYLVEENWIIVEDKQEFQKELEKEAESE